MISSSRWSGYVEGREKLGMTTKDSITSGETKKVDSE
jgi:hypothetical protein